MQKIYSIHGSSDLDWSDNLAGSLKSNCRTFKCRQSVVIPPHIAEVISIQASGGGS